MCPPSQCTQDCGSAADTKRTSVVGATAPQTAVVTSHGVNSSTLVCSGGGSSSSNRMLGCAGSPMALAALPVQQQQPQKHVVELLVSLHHTGAMTQRLHALRARLKAHAAAEPSSGAQQTASREFVQRVQTLAREGCYRQLYELLSKQQPELLEECPAVAFELARCEFDQVR